MSTAIQVRPIPGEWRWTGDLAARAAESGLLADPHRYELIDGRLLEKMPQSDLHYGIVFMLAEALAAVYGSDFRVRTESPIRGDEHNEPEPDISVVRGDARRYLGRKPSADDIELVIEVAQASRKFDLGDKRDLYARIGIKEYWVVDLVEERIEIFTHPRQGTYTQSLTILPGEDAPKIGIKLGEVLAQARAAQADAAIAAE